MYVLYTNGSGVQGTCKYGTRMDYILSSRNSAYRFVPGSYMVFSSKGTSDHHIVKVDVTKVVNCSNIPDQPSYVNNKKRRQGTKRVVKITNPSQAKGIWKTTEAEKDMS